MVRAPCRARALARVLAVLGACAASHADDAAPASALVGGVGPCVFSFDGPGLRYDLTSLMGPVTKATDANNFPYAFCFCDRLPPRVFSKACDRPASVAQLDASSSCLESLGDSASAVATPAVDAAGGLQLTYVKSTRYILVFPLHLLCHAAFIWVYLADTDNPPLRRIFAGYWAATLAGPLVQVLRRCACSRSRAPRGRAAPAPHRRPSHSRSLSPTPRPSPPQVFNLHCDTTASQLIVDSFTRSEGSACTIIVDGRAAAACPSRYTPVFKPLGAAYIGLGAAVVVAAVYLVGGMAYKRAVLGASGFESVPNIDTWRYVGRCLCGRCSKEGHAASEPGVAYESLELPENSLPAPSAPGFVTVKR